jgi:hypothetical protein
LIDQPAHGTTSAFKSPRLEDFPQERDENHLGRDKRLTENKSRQASLRERKIGPDPSLEKRPKRTVNDINRTQNGRHKRQRQTTRQPCSAQQAEDDITGNQRSQKRGEREERLIVVIDAPAGGMDYRAVLVVMQIIGSKFTVHRGWLYGP